MTEELHVVEKPILSVPILALTVYVPKTLLRILKQKMFNSAWK